MARSYASHQTMLLALLLFAAPAVLPSAEATPASTGLYEPLDIHLSSSRPYTNPFRDVLVSATVRGPGNRTLAALAVYDGSAGWLLRLSFDRLGEWVVKTAAEPDDPALRREFTVQVSPSGADGPVRVEGSRQGFVHANGKPYFHSGDTCYPLLGLNREKQLLPYLRRRREQGFSHIRFEAPYTDARFPQLWPWGRTPDDPDLDRLNPAYFAHMDAVMKDLRSHHLLAEIILENFYPGGGPMRKPGSVDTPSRA